MEYINILTSGLKSEEFNLDIYKAFENVWQVGLIYKLKQNGVKGNFLGILTNFLKDGKQGVVLNGQHLKQVLPMIQLLDHNFL